MVVEVPGDAFQQAGRRLLKVHVVGVATFDLLKKR
jgi:hypothetical protein